MWTSSSGGEGVVMVEDFHPEEMFLDVAARVSGPGNTELTVPLKQIGPRRYQGTFSARDKGRYQVSATGKSGDREDRVHGGFIVSYSPEFLKFTSNWETLRQIKDVTQRRGAVRGVQSGGHLQPSTPQAKLAADL